VPVPTFTEKQGQYLAFIHTYTLIHREPPAEADMQRFFRVTPPSVHRMVVELADKGLITRISGAARSIRLVLDPTNLPPLREPEPIRSPAGDH
jgi:Mn-dependent DtxR family transcriptional regulator